MNYLFLSYAHLDSDRVMSLHDDLQYYIQHRIWIDTFGLRAGDPFKSAIKEALEQSQGVVYVLTNNYLKSEFNRDYEIPWGRERFKEALDRGENRIFILRLEDVKLPGESDVDAADTHRWLGTLQYVNALDGNYKQAGDNIYLVVREWPEAPSDLSFGVLTGSENFHGRKELVQEVHTTMISSSKKPVALYGLGGIGKTSIAIEYAHRYAWEHEQEIFWINVADDWQNTIADFATDLGLEAAYPGLLPAVAFNLYLRRPIARSLVVLDGVPDPEDALRIAVLKIFGVSPDAFPVPLLITTRVKPPQEYAAIQIPVLSLSASREVLTFGRVNTLTTQELDEIAGKLGQLPQALILAATALEAYFQREFLDNLRRMGIDDIAKRAGVSEKHLVEPVLDWHFKQLPKSIDSQAREMLALVAAYPEASVIPVGRLKVMLSSAFSTGTDLPFLKIYHDLVKLALLIEVEHDQRVTMHPLVHDYILHQLDTRTILRRCAKQLVKAYRNPTTLQEEAISRGFGELVADLRDTNAALTKLLPSLKNLLLMFASQESLMRNWNAEKVPNYLIQQIRECAFHEGDDRLVNACDRWLYGHLHFQTQPPYRFPIHRKPNTVSEGHRGYIWDVAVIPDGRYALSASQDMTLHLWDLRERQTVRVFSGHTGPVNCVVLIDDGKKALSGSTDGTICLWDLETDRAKYVFAGHGGAVQDLAVLPNGRTFLSVSTDGTLRWWDIETKTTKRILFGQGGPLFSVDTFPDGQHIVIGDAEGYLRIWDITAETDFEEKAIQAIKSAGQIYDLATFSDGQHILAAYEDGIVRKWNWRTGKVVGRLSGHDGAVTSVEIYDGGRSAITASIDTTIRVWDLGSYETVKMIQDHPDWVQCAATLPDGTEAVTGCDDGSVRLLDLTQERTMAVFRGVIPLLWEILPISTQLALVASADGTIKFWDLSTNTVLRSLVGHTGAVIGLALRKEGKEIVSVSWDRTVRLWDFETGSEVSTLHGHTDGVVDVDVEEPGSRALTSSYDGTVRMWNLETGETLDVFTGHNGGIMAVRALSNWNAMITASDDMTLRLWNLRVPKRKTQKVLRGPVGSVWNIIFVDEDERIGTHVISVGEDPVMRLWNLKTGQSQEYKGHTDAVCGATILNKGKWVASVSDDGTVRLWDLQSATELAVLHVPEIPQCIASLSERSFAIGDTDGNLQVIEIAGAREGTDI